MKPGRDNYNRLYEILTLINALRQSVRGLSYEDICDKFNWGRRTAERMLNLIENQYPHNFVRERGDDNKRYFYLTAGDIFPPSCISENEIVALKTALGLVKFNEPLRLPLERLAGKLETFKNKSPSNIEDLTLVNGTASAPRPYMKLDKKIIEPLREAILAFKMVQIEYKKLKEPSDEPLSICPLGFLYGVQNNYLIAAYSKEITKPRHYILDKILNVKILNKSFDAKGFDIHKYAIKSFGSFISSKNEGYKIKWRVLPEAAEKAKRFMFHKTQKIILQDDGSLIVEFVADGLKEMVWHLITWEGKIEPIAPKELIAEYKNQLKLALNVLKKSSKHKI